MKNLLFGFMAVAAFTTLSSFTSLDTEAGTVPCKWRTIKTIDGVQYASAWTEGNCNVTHELNGSTTLTPIK